MSKYTTEVRYICEVNAGLTESKGYNDVEKIIADSRTKIFDFDYPIFDDEYRSVLERKILRHYYTREIGFETVGLWKLKLNMKLNDIMPYYNQLYKSELIKFNPLYDVDLTIDHNKVDNGISTNIANGTSKLITDSENSKIGNSKDIIDTDTTGSGTSKDIIDTDTTTSGNSKDIIDTDTTGSGTSNSTTNYDSVKWDEYSDTPQGTVGNIENLTYLTNARKNTVDDTTTVSGSFNERGTVDTTDTKTWSETGTADTTDTKTWSETGTADTTDTKTWSENGTLDTTVTGTTTDSQNGTIKNTQDYLEHVNGKRSGASYSKMLTEFRETFLNIDLMIIEELSDLFMYLW